MTAGSMADINPGDIESMEILKDASKIDTSSMTTKELINFRNAYQQVVDTLTHTIRLRKICEQKHKAKN